MEELEELKRRMREERPMEWDSFPDIGLYMDQVLSYMPRQLIDLGETETLTSAMVNNYIKDGLLPRAEGKKYSRTHLAYLTAICAMKQVISVRDACELIREGERLGLAAEAVRRETPEEKQGGSTRLIYDYFCRELDRALDAAASQLPDQADREELPKLALRLALNSYAQRLACQRVLNILARDRAEESGREPRKKGREPAADQPSARR